MYKCKCRNAPDRGSFRKGEVYEYDYGMDFVFAIDDNGDRIDFDNEFVFLWYFTFNLNDKY